jgi:hypothetical protein
MGKYTTFEPRRGPKSNEPHPIWRGIGCVIMLIVPVISYALSVMTVKLAAERGIPIPEALSGYPVMPEALFSVPGLVPILTWVQNQYNLYAYLFMTFFFIVIVAGLIAVVYAALYRATGPSRFSGYDAPPPSRKIKKYKR